MPLMLRAGCKYCDDEVVVKLKHAILEISTQNAYFNCPKCNRILEFTSLPDSTFELLYRQEDANVIFIPLGKDLETKPPGNLTLDDAIDLHLALRDY